jgi:hypothetical protein
MTHRDYGQGLSSVCLKDLVSLVFKSKSSLLESLHAGRSTYCMVSVQIDKSPPCGKRQNLNFEFVLKDFKSKPSLLESLHAGRST